jgi:hypothetical protein
MKSLKGKISTSCKSLCLTGQHVHRKGILKFSRNKILQISAFRPCTGRSVISIDSKYILKVAAPWQIYTVRYQMTCDFTIRNKHIRAQQCDSAPRI